MRVSLQRGFDGAEPLPWEARARTEEVRYAPRSSTLGTGTLACPRCDAPVAPPRALAPAEPLACPFCDHGAAVRDFLTLGDPTRPARVLVRVVTGRR